RPTTTKPAADPLRVRYLELQDFRCFEQLRLDFAQQGLLPGLWTCLVGINGAGKSSVLQALALVLLGDPLCRQLAGPRIEGMQPLANGKPKEARVRLWLEQGTERQYAEVKFGVGVRGENVAMFSPPRALSAIWKLIRERVVVAYGSTRNLSDFVDSRHS